MKRKSAAVLLLAGIDLVCAIFHAVFQADLLQAEGRYRGFLLTENLVVCFAFALFAYAFLFEREQSRPVLARMSAMFWSALLVSVLVLRPQVTTLSLVARYLFLPQYCYLLLIGAAALGLSVISLRQRGQ